LSIISRRHCAVMALGGLSCPGGGTEVIGTFILLARDGDQRVDAVFFKGLDHLFTNIACVGELGLG
jgi:hypothetical protein